MDRIALKQNIENFRVKLDSLIKVLNIEKTNSRINEFEKEAGDASFWQDQNHAKVIFNELNDLKAKIDDINKLKSIFENLSILQELSDEDESYFNQADLEIDEFNKLYIKLETKLLLSNKEDECGCIIEIHSGAGGTESLDWVSMLFRMYQMYLQKKKYKITILDYQAGDEVGIKSVSIKVEGSYAYGMLKSESGVHRLIRLSPFDSDHARHTTFASVLVTPLVPTDIDIRIDEKDIRVDVFHSSGAGGQGVNTTDSAVRITYLPLKIIVTCQNERSQIQNKEAALNVLKSKLYKIELENQKKMIDSMNTKQDISFGSQIRTYTFHPYSLVKDHRTNFETSQVNKVMDGELDDFINAYLRYKGENNE